MTPEEKQERLAKKRAARRWHLIEAVGFLTRLQAHFKANDVLYFAGLTGSVLYGETHESDNDLDVILYPMHRDAPAEDHLKAAMREFGMKPLFDRAFVAARWREAGSPDTKHVEVWEHEGKRVDIFFLS